MKLAICPRMGLKGEHRFTKPCHASGFNTTQKPENCFCKKKKGASVMPAFYKTKVKVLTILFGPVPPPPPPLLAVCICLPYFITVCNIPLTSQRSVRVLKSGAWRRGRRVRNVLVRELVVGGALSRRRLLACASSGFSQV